MDTEKLRRLAEQATPGPDGIIRDPDQHHPYCQYRREGGACSCVEGREADHVVMVEARVIRSLLDEQDQGREDMRSAVRANAAYERRLTELETDYKYNGEQWHKRVAALAAVLGHMEKPTTAVVEEPGLFYVIERKYVDEARAILGPFQKVRESD